VLHRRKDTVRDDRHKLDLVKYNRIPTWTAQEAFDIFIWERLFSPICSALIVLFRAERGGFFLDILVFDYTNIPRNNSIPFSLLMPSSPPHCEKRCSSFEKKKISPTLEHKSPQPLRLDNESSETYLLGHLHLTSIKTVIQGLDRPASSTHHLQQNPYQGFHN
jgi:hypothetical protein